MKKIGAYIVLVTLLFGAFSHAEQSPAPTRSDVILLKDKIAKLEAQLKDLNNKFVATVDEDMKILSALRQENRALKLQVRSLKRAQESADKDVSDFREQRRAARRAAIDTDNEDSRESLAAARARAAQNSVKEATAQTSALKSAGKVSVSEKDASKPEVKAAEKKDDAKVEEIRETEKAAPSKSGSIWDNVFPF